MGKFEMMAMRGFLTAHQTRHTGDCAQMCLVAIAPLGADLQARLVDPWPSRDQADFAMIIGLDLNARIVETIRPHA